MTFRFISPGPDGSVTDIAIEADDLHAAFVIFAKQHWNPDCPSFGVWREGSLIARVYTGLVIATGSVEPLYHPVEAPPHDIGRGMARPSEN